MAASINLPEHEFWSLSGEMLCWLRSCYSDSAWIRHVLLPYDLLTFNGLTCRTLVGQGTDNPKLGSTYLAAHAHFRAVQPTDAHTVNTRTQYG